MTHDELAESLIAPLWRGISNDYKRKYSLKIWQQFEDNLRSAAYTSRASEFLSRITTRLGIEIAAADVKKVADTINSGADKQILKMLREDSSLLVLLVRVANEEKKEKFKMKQKGEAENADFNL